MKIPIKVSITLPAKESQAMYMYRLKVEIFSWLPDDRFKDKAVLKRVKAKNKRQWKTGGRLYIYLFGSSYRITPDLYKDSTKVRYSTELRINGWKPKDFLRTLKFWQPVYYMVFSRDCDMCETTSIHKYKNYREAMREYEEASEWAEGALSYTEVSADEYVFNEGATHTRDRIMEAYENGNGSSIYV